MQIELPWGRFMVLVIRVFLWRAMNVCVFSIGPPNWIKQHTHTSNLLYNIITNKFTKNTRTPRVWRTQSSIPCGLCLVVVLRCNHRDWHVQIVQMVEFWNYHYKQCGGHMFIVGIWSSTIFVFSQCLYHYLVYWTLMYSLPFWHEMRVLTLEQLVEMPNKCILAKSMHNKWL